MATENIARPGSDSEAGRHTTGGTLTTVRRAIRVEIDRCPRGLWSLVRWLKGRD